MLEVAKVIMIKALYVTPLLDECPLSLRCNCGFLQRRLDDMLYVGITEDHKESATMFANVVGAQVISQLTESAVNNETSGKCCYCYFHYGF